MKLRLRIRRTPLTIFKEGDVFTKLSFLVWGLSNMVRGQIVKGAIYLAMEVAFVYYMITSGLTNLVNLTTLGTHEQGMVFNETLGIYEVQQGDNSMLMLLYGVVAIVVVAMAIVVWMTSVYSGEDARQRKISGRRVYGITDDITSLFDTHIVRLFLCLPLIGILVFTVTPLIYMILMAFTNYDANHQPPGHLFTWVGLENFRAIMDASGQLGATFLPILAWTLILGRVCLLLLLFRRNVPGHSHQLQADQAEEDVADGICAGHGHSLLHLPAGDQHHAGKQRHH